MTDTKEHKLIYHSSLVPAEYLSDYIKLAITSPSFHDWTVSDSYNYQRFGETINVLVVAGIWKENY